ncbi:hypothetical protein BS47DRAFT_1336402 [Hydnum rufescens UP504]|uniref:Uncharacterized protein n=1 Tax=Hydnum rufescens UP504 TaxID=1448309 RepID=A0A9P6E1T9_9AGAM|nr:hypothetical protein BS47DRAFT_1336402 [Hydnum rufescens UP504]
MAFFLASSTKIFKGIISLHPCNFVVPVTLNGYQNLRTYIRADPKHDVSRWSHAHHLKSSDTILTKHSDGKHSCFFHSL